MRRVFRGIRDAMGATNGLFSSALTLVSGTVVTQALVFLASPLLSRIYDVAEFASLANYGAWLTFLTLIACLRYDHAIITAASERIASRIAGVALVLCLGFAVAFGLVLTVFGGADHRVAYLDEVAKFAVWLPFGVITAGASSVLAQLGIRKGKFKLIAIATVIQSGCTIIPQLLLGIFNVENGLIIGTVTGYAASGVLLTAMVANPTQTKWRGALLTPRGLRRTAWGLRQFPAFTMPADAIGVVVQYFGAVFVLALFGPVPAGLFAFAIRVIRVPLIVIATAVAGSLRNAVANSARTGIPLAALYRTTVRNLLVIGIIPFTVLALTAPSLFGIVFGPQWSAAGKLSQVLSPGMLAEFVAFPVMTFFLATGRQRQAFLLQLFGFALFLGGLLFGRYWLDDFQTTCYLVSGAMVATSVATVVLGGRAASAHSVRPTDGHDDPAAVGTPSLGVS